LGRVGRIIKWLTCTSCAGKSPIWGKGAQGGKKLTVHVVGRKKIFASKKWKAAPCIPRHFL